MSRDPNVIRIKPYHYIHVLDNNTNVTRVEVGPNTYTRQVRTIYTPLVCVVIRLVSIPTHHHCRIRVILWPNL